MTSGRIGRLIAVIVAMSTVLTACWGGDDDAGPTATTTPTTIPSIDAPTINVGGVDETNGVAATQLGLTLSEGTRVEQPVDTIELVTGEPIAPDDVAAIFDRLPGWDVPDDDRTEFERPARTLPPPLVGDTVETVFPPPGDGGAPADPEPGPLRVLRFQPDGEVVLAPFLSVTFDQPMVPLATLGQLDAAEVPVVLTPATEGRWRWIGTRTLRFEVEPGELDRLPAATEYEVVVPAGTESATGAVLADEVRWTFATPAPTVTSFTGNADSTGLTPVFVAVFDQRVDGEAVVASTTLDVGGEDVDVRVATQDEIDADPAARRAFGAALESRAVAFRPVDPLPPDTAFTVRLGPGTPSAEGPRTSTEAATFSGRTFGSLTIRDTRCGGGDTCEPGASFTIEFSNALDPEQFSGDQLTIQPGIANLTVDVFGSVVELRGETVGRTTYEITFDGSLTDVFGQSLGEDATVDFRVGSAPPALLGLSRQWLTVDPAAERPTVDVTTVNHESVRVRAWAVSPADLDEFGRYQEAMWSDAEAPDPDWPLVLDERIEIDAEEDQYVETVIDLEAGFERSISQLVVRIDPTREFSENDDDYWRNRPTVAWVQSTTLGIDAFFDHERLVIWTTDLVTGEPLGGVPVELIGDGRIATTDEGGLAELELGDAGVRGLWATADDSTAFLPAAWYDGWRAEPRTDEGRWYIFDDRGIYRPGQTVRLTGWVRRLAWSEDAQLALYADASTVRYTVWDPQGEELGAGEADVNALGGFNMSIDLPEGANLGQAWVEIELPGGGSESHSFAIQEFRRPEFEVSAANESPGPFYAAEPATVRVDAEYFSGGPLPDAEVNWLVTTQDTTYRPPNRDDYTFGVWVPWWIIGGGLEDVAVASSEPCYDCGPGTETRFEEFVGRTDAGGSHFLQIDFSGPDVDLPTTVSAEATVFDVNRQAWSSRTDVLVHSAEYYVGLRSDRAFVRQGTPIRIDAIVTDVDGAAVAGRAAEVTAGRLEWMFTDGQWSERLTDEQTCELTSTGEPSDGSMRCEFTTEVGGTYRITATVADDDGRRNRTELTQWVSGGGGRPNRAVEQEPLTIVPDREHYAPGDTAELLVQAPFAPASGIVNILRGGIVATESFEAEDGSAVVEIPIDDSMIPNIEVQVDMTGSAERFDDDGVPQPDLPERPAFATGRIGLSIPPVARALDVIATPADDAVEPGADTAVSVAVTDADGAPVAEADVAVVVVDEAVLSLTGYELTDPLDVFYRDIWSNVNAEYTRTGVVLTRADLVAGNGDLDGALGRNAAPTGEAATEESADVAADAGGGEAAPQIDLRTNFDALALYAPSESTDADGKVTVDVSLPDSLTRYRVMAVAIAGADRFGKGEATITARLPLQVRPSPPRFLNFGDRFELPVVVQNLTDEPMEAQVAVQLSNLTATGPIGRSVTVPANDRIEVRFAAKTDRAGTARFRVAAVSGDLTDAVADELPVYTPATAEAFATYGVVDDGPIAQPTSTPTDVFPQFGGLEINTSSTALQALTDAVIYLHDYRYDSSDGLASRVMAIATLRDVLEAFDAEGLPGSGELDSAVARDLDRLAALQNDDGGWPYWQRGRESIPWVSIQTAHALVIAQQHGYDVPADTLDRALDHLVAIDDFIPADYSEQVRNTLRAYALYVRGEGGRAGTAEAAALYDRAGDDLELDAVTWLWPSISDETTRAEIVRRLENAAVETAGAATFATSYGEDAYLIAHSDRRTDGIVLDALITQAPDSDLIPKVVSGLLGGQTRGRWNNAHENAFILVALDKYFASFEAATPEFVARVWLGDLHAVDETFSGRSTDRVSTLIPMNRVIAAGDTNVVVQKEGAGRLYYRLGLRYAPSDLQLGARDEGFVVDRLYEAVDDPADVRRRADGTWTIRAGAEVRVTLTMVADARRTHVALIDPLPAGLEAINPALDVAQTIPPDDDGDESALRFWWWSWYEHDNLRDDRAEAFASFLPGGTYEYSYVARATTPGRFVVPPARAEEIYAPEVFGRSSAALVVIE